jgi:putative transcriptional regulator
MDTEKVINKVNKLLKEANFETFVFKSPSCDYCYDLIVKKHETVFIVKIIPNIDNLADSLIESIKSLSRLLNSKPLLIGVKNRYQSLEKNTIYIRNDLPIISIETLENILQKNLYPYVLARRGGGVIFLNGELMKTLRKEKRLSRKELSEEIGVTKRTVCSYESGRMRPSSETAEKIIDVLEDEERELFKKINVFDWKIKFSFSEKQSFEKSELSSFESHLQTVINDIGITGYWYKKGKVPFELSILSRDYKKKTIENFYPLFSSISEKEKKLKDLNFQALKTFTEFFHKNALFIVNNEFKIPRSLLKGRIPFIKIKDLEKIDDEKEFREFIETGVT